MKETKRLNHAREALSRYMADHGLRHTPERFAILEAVTAFTRPFTVDNLGSVLSKSDFRVSRATLYNTVALMQHAGIIEPDATRRGHWQLSGHPHATTLRMVCRLCGRIREVSDPALMAALMHPRTRAFVPESCSVTITGHCKRCRPDGTP